MKIDFSQRELIDFGLAPYVLDPINENINPEITYSKSTGKKGNCTYEKEDDLATFYSVLARECGLV